MQIIPLSAVIATRNRAPVLRRTLESLRGQGWWPQELIIVDASDDKETKATCDELLLTLPKGAILHYFPAIKMGAATQREQGVQSATLPFVWFLDDDILFEPGCVEQLWTAISSDDQLGAANAMITNQCLVGPGKVTRIMLSLMGGGPPYGGKIVGPAINLLPEDRADLPAIVRVDWVNTTCTIYRRAALPLPVFSSHFQGYSLMEDVSLSITIGRNWRLANVRTARIFHDSQPGSHKSDAREVRRMQLVNRHYVMTELLGRRDLLSLIRMISWELFGLVCGVLTRSVDPGSWKGAWAGFREIFARRKTGC